MDVGASPPSAGASLSRSTIWRLVTNGDLVTPRPSPSEVDNGTIDLRLGSLFLIGKRSSVAAMSTEHPEEGEKLFNEVRIRSDRDLVLQPHQFVLATTLQYLALPEHVCGLIQSRSTIGRMGVVAVAAAWVAPGYKGSPTLEIYNAGDIAIKLRPFGVPFCQVILLRAERDAPKRSRYHCATRPLFARKQQHGLAGRWDWES